MIQIGDILVSDELFDRKFVCDLTACKGACCVDGDSGAPLEEEELAVLDDVYGEVRPFLRPEGIKAIEEQGTYIVDTDGDYVTPLVNEEECAYVVFDRQGTAKCGIEQAYLAGKIEFRKPVSCHLYPIRVLRLPEGQALNYNEWSICRPACACGEKLDVPVYRFLKEPIIRHYGNEFYEALEAAAAFRKQGENGE